MAKLSARGAHKVIEFRKTIRNADGSFSETRRCYRSDGKILDSHRSQWESLGSRMDRDKNPESPIVFEWLDWSGWSIRGKIKDGLTVNDWANLYRSKGWTEHK